MEIKKFQLVNRTATVNLPIFGAQPSDLFVLKGADGLGPGAINLIAPDGVFQGVSTVDRELVFKIGLNPVYDSGSYRGAGQLRSDLYRLLNPQNGGIIIKAIGPLNDDPEHVWAQTQGYARNFEINPFSTTPEVMVTISCPDKPHWESPTEQAPSIFAADTAMFIPNIGEVDTGFKLVISPQQDISGFSMVSLDTDEKLEIDYAFEAFDIITINTIEGQREVKVQPSGDSLLGYLTEDSTWPKALAGGTAFTITDGLFDGDVYYTPLYWGV